MRLRQLVRRRDSEANCLAASQQLGRNEVATTLQAEHSASSAGDDLQPKVMGLTLERFAALDTWSGVRPVKANMPIWSVIWFQFFLEPVHNGRHGKGPRVGGGLAAGAINKYARPQRKPTRYGYLYILTRFARTNRRSRGPFAGQRASC